MRSNVVQAVVLLFAVAMVSAQQPALDTWVANEDAAAAASKRTGIRGVA
jgi:hypothetical protein